MQTSLNGSIQNKRPGAGVYPGAGVAAGGQQGRLGVMHGGVGGAKTGGATAGASQRAPVKSVVQSAHAVAAAPSKTKYAYVTRGGQRVAVNQTLLTPAEKLKLGLTKPGAPITPQPGGVIPSPSPTAASPAVNLHDSQYFMDLAGLTGQFDTQRSPLQAELAKLQYHGVGGKTLYDTMYDRANAGFMDSISQQRDAASKSGLLRSGYGTKQLNEMGDAWTQQQADLSNQYGEGRINELNTQQAQLAAQQAQQQSLLELAAEQRKREAMAASNAAVYGQTIMPAGE